MADTRQLANADGVRQTPAARSPTLALLALAMGGFTIGTTEFTSMSLLPQMARGLGIDAPTAGDLHAFEVAPASSAAL